MYNIRIFQFSHYNISSFLFSLFIIDRCWLRTVLQQLFIFLLYLLRLQLVLYSFIINVFPKDIKCNKVVFLRPVFTPNYLKYCLKSNFPPDPSFSFPFKNGMLG